MMLHETLRLLSTEAINPATTEIDALDSKSIVSLLNAEDATVASAVSLVLNEVALAVDLVVQTLSVDGSLIYVGSGTSGRLGVVDASEMPPTYGTQDYVFQGLIAGGPTAVFKAIEGAEDSELLGADDVLRAIGNRASVVCGISASGRTPYVVGALKAAHKAGHATVLISTNDAAIVQRFAPFVDVLICPVVGPEPIAGSTRMKSGTAQKMILNMISTASMVQMGKTYGNVMVDLQLTNEKLVERARTIIMRLVQVEYNQASLLLEASHGHVKSALVMGTHSCTFEEAQQRLHRANGKVRLAMLDHDRVGGL